MIELPPALTNAWSTHGYYGSVSHNVKAIYQRYMGWFDGNPARLWPHPPAELAARYVAAHRRHRPRRRARPGGVRRGRLPVGGDAAGPRGVHRRRTTPRPARCTPTPSNSSATAPRTAPGATSSSPAPPSCATATSAPRPRPPPRDRRSAHARSSSSTAIAISVNGPRAWDLDLSLDVTFTDLDTNYRLTLRNGVLIYVKRAADGTAAATLTLTKARLIGLLGGRHLQPRHRYHRRRERPPVAAGRAGEGRPVVQHRDALAPDDQEDTPWTRPELRGHGRRVHSPRMRASTLLGLRSCCGSQSAVDQLMRGGGGPCLRPRGLASRHAQDGRDGVVRHGRDVRAEGRLLSVPRTPQAVERYEGSRIVAIFEDFRGSEAGVAPPVLRVSGDVLPGAGRRGRRHDGPGLPEHDQPHCRRGGAGADGDGDHPVHGQGVRGAPQSGGQHRVRAAG